MKHKIAIFIICLLAIDLVILGAGYFQVIDKHMLKMSMNFVNSIGWSAAILFLLTSVKKKQR